MERCGARSGPTVMWRLGSFDLSNGFLLLASGMARLPVKCWPHHTKRRGRLLGAYLPGCSPGYFMDTTSMLSTPPGLRSSTLSPTRAFNSALATGETQETL